MGRPRVAWGGMDGTSVCEVGVRSVDREQLTHLLLLLPQREQIAHVETESQEAHQQEGKLNKPLKPEHSPAECEGLGRGSCVDIMETWGDVRRYGGVWGDVAPEHSPAKCDTCINFRLSLLFVEAVGEGGDQ